MPMQDTDKKLEAFTDTIISEAMDEANKITFELRDRQNAMIRDAETAIAAEAERYQKSSIAEIRAGQERRISAKLNNNKHTLLEYREAWANEMHKQVVCRINDFTASEAYLPHLKALLKKAIDFLGYGLSAEVFLRPEDMKYADELLKSTSGVSLAFCEGVFTLGGLRVVCHSKGQRIDMSFDTAMGDMVGHFSEIAGLKMDE
ncbi:MAG: V-type ATP synthase subunit E [Oscillospiraceae bacterium]|nr:V-type ATP synthase subunit E [Oscillospiraceae bacterium]